MKKNANYLILPDLKLIIECCKGQANTEDATIMKRDEVADILYNPDFNVIVDLRDLKSIVNTTSVQAMTAFVPFLEGLGIKSKVAFLTTKPNQVVVAEILKNLSKKLTIDFKTFSTPEAAIKHIGCPGDKYKIVIEKLKELNRNMA